MVDATQLVGRRHELARLAAALEGARAGRGCVVSVAGEPGVGKTTLLRAFASAPAGALWGTCFEGPAQPAYGPWTTALAPLGVELPAVDDLSAPEARLRRWATVHQALTTGSSAAPLVVVLDDLQWASTETLDLLGYVAARIDESSVLLVTSYRDPDPALQGGTPLTLLLAELARLPGYGAIEIGGLGVAEVGAYLRASFGDDVPGAIVGAVHDHTAGNPFYVREVTKALVDEGKLVRRDGRWSSDFSLPALGIPATVRHAVRGRLARLDSGTQALLQAASAFSADLGLEPLRDVAGLDEAVALDAVDRALATGFLVRAVGARPDAPYAFAHAIVRDAVAGTLSPDRAARLHRRAAVALEKLRPAQHAAIAEQYWLSRALPGASAGIAHCLTAAELAAGQHASRHSTRLLRLALDLADEAAVRQEVLRRLAVAQAEDLDADAAPATTLLALDGAGADTGAEIVVRVAEALREGAPAAAWQPLVRRGLELVGARRGPAWARLVTLLDPVDTVVGGRLRAGRWRGYPPDAVRILGSTGQEDDDARAIDPFRARSEAETADLLARSSTWARPRPRMRALDLVGRDLSLRHGRPRHAADCYRELLELGERVGSMPAQAEAHGQLAICLALTGEIVAAEGHLAESVSLTRDLWPGHRLHLMGTVSSASVLAYLRGDGDWAALAGRLDHWLRSPAAAVAPFSNVFAALAAVAHAMAGDAGETRELLSDLVSVLEAMSPFDHAVAGTLWFSAAAASEIADREAAEGLAALTERHLRSGGPPGPASVDHAAGRLAALLGRDGTARHHLQAARGAADGAGSDGVRALVDFDLAVLDTDPAAVATVRRTFDLLGMRGWARRAADWRPPSPGRWPSHLTAREVEVLRLLAAGRTTAEIAGALVVAPATVNRHIANIYVKIGARNRAEATGFAISHGIASA